MRVKNPREEEGQAAVFIALLLVFALIALTALAIDGGHLYVVRRDLQNIADAACLAAATELSLHGSEDDAYNSALEYIVANGGDADLYTPQDGAGVDLLKGVQVSEADVRVALQTVVDTYFTAIFNRSGAVVGARSHCNAVAAGGLLPIAVRRFEYNEDEPDQQLDLMANKDADPRNPLASCQGTPDCAYPANCTATSWNGKYGPMTVYLPKPGYVPEDGGLTDMTTGNVDCDLPPGDGIYEGTCVLGDGVDTNSETANFRGFVLLDARNIASGPIEYYNGATGQATTNKDISEQYFHTGYRGPLPQVGDQLAMLDGVSNDFAAEEMSQYWDVGDEFAAIVYSGFIWDKPDLEVSIDPDENPLSPTFPCAGDPVTYTVELKKAGPAPWHSHANFQLDAFFTDQGGAYGVIAPTVGFSENPVQLPLGQPSVPVKMTVYAANCVTTTTYLSALTVRARETGLDLTRWASTSFRYGDVEPDFALYAGALEFSVPQGGSLAIPLTTRGFGFNKNNAPLSAAPEEYAWVDVFTSSQSGKIHIKDHTDTEKTFTLSVRDNATPGLYYVLLTVDYDPPGPTTTISHGVTIAVNVYAPTPGGEPTRFLIVEAFALFRVSYIDENTIAAYGIGAITDDPSSLISGQNPRLLLWAAP